MRIIRRIYAMLLVVILLMTMIGCRYTPADDPRLMLADSLMEENPDSAYALLSDIVPVGKSNTAYHALLLTQSQYKSYKEIKNDSLISIAVDYYRTYTFNPEANILYARSLLNKGNALAEMKDYDGATDCLMAAKDRLDSLNPSHYKVFAEVNYRLGALYAHEYFDTKDIFQYFLPALSYYEKTGNKKYQYFCHEWLGSLTRIRNPKQSYYYIRRAKAIGIEMKDSFKINHADVLLVGALYADSSYKELKDVALGIDTTRIYEYERNEIYAYLSIAYSKLMMPDSALYYFNQAKLDTLSNQYKVLSYLARENVAYVIGNYKDAYEYRCKSIAETTRALDKARREEILEADRKYRNDLLKKENETMQYRILSLILASVVIVVLLIYFVKVQIRKRHEVESIVAEIEERNQSLRLELDSLKELLEAEADNTTDEDIVKMKRYIISEWSAYTTKIIVVLKEIQLQNIKSKVDFLAAYNSRKIKIQLTERFWQSMENVLNHEYNNIVVRFEELLNGNLTMEYKRILLLLSYGFPRNVVCECLNYSGEKTLNTIMSRISQKMGLSESLASYINSQISK